MIELSKEARARLEGAGHVSGVRLEIGEALAALDSTVAEVSNLQTSLDSERAERHRVTHVYASENAHLKVANGSLDRLTRAEDERHAIARLESQLCAIIREKDREIARLESQLCAIIRELGIEADVDAGRDPVEAARAMRVSANECGDSVARLENARLDAIASAEANRKEVEWLRPIVESCVRDAASTACRLSDRTLNLVNRYAQALASPQPATGPGAVDTTQAPAGEASVAQPGMATPPAYVSVEFRDGIPTLTAWTREAWDGKTPFPRTAYTRSDIVDRAVALLNGPGRFSIW